MTNPTPVHYRAGSYAGDDNASGGTWIDCAVAWDAERHQWRATATPLVDQPPIVAHADTKHAAALAVFARWLGCERELVAALKQI